MAARFAGPTCSIGPGRAAEGRWQAFSSRADLQWTPRAAPPLGISRRKARGAFKPRRPSLIAAARHGEGHWPAFFRTLRHWIRAPAEAPCAHRPSASVHWRVHRWPFAAKGLAPVPNGPPPTDHLQWTVPNGPSAIAAPTSPLPHRQLFLSATGRHGQSEGPLGWAPSRGLAVRASIGACGARSHAPSSAGDRPMACQ